MLYGKPFKSDWLSGSSEDVAGGSSSKLLMILGVNFVRSIIIVLIPLPPCWSIFPILKHGGALEISADS